MACSGAFVYQGIDGEAVSRHGGVRGEAQPAPDLNAAGCAQLSSLYGHNSTTSGNVADAPALVTIYAYPDGSFSGCASMRHGKPREGELRDISAWANLTPEERSLENRQRSERRAAQTLRRLVRAGDLRRLLTFTNGGAGEGWTCARDAVHDVMGWYRKGGGRELLGNTGFVLVAERGGKRRRWHVHAAIRAGYRLPYRKLIASWSAWLTSKGYSSPTGTHRWHAGDEKGRGRDGFASARVCAGYLSKYLTKGFELDERQAYEKRFRSADCLVPDPDRYTGGLLREVPSFLVERFTDAHIKCEWFQHGDYGGYFFEIDP